MGGCAVGSAEGSGDSDHMLAVLVDHPQEAGVVNEPKDETAAATHPQGEASSGPLPAIIRLGILTAGELAEFGTEERLEMETTTLTLSASYGEEAVPRDRERHRRDSGVVLWCAGVRRGAERASHQRGATGI